MTRKRRASFTRRGPAPKETLMWGLRGIVPRDFWAFAGALPGQRIGREKPAPEVRPEQYLETYQ